jgi:hypothetical protein
VSFQIDRLPTLLTLGCCPVGCRRAKPASKAKPCRWGRWKVIGRQVESREKIVGLVKGTGCPVKGRRSSRV